MAKRLIFLLGGARSGKSHYAETWAREHGKRVLYTWPQRKRRTPTCGDASLIIAPSRPPDWQTLEAPIDTARQIAAATYEHDTLILDCVTLMTSNILLDLPDCVNQKEANEAALYAQSTAC